jgi:hypothetical protein
LLAGALTNGRSRKRIAIYGWLPSERTLAHATQPTLPAGAPLRLEFVEMIYGTGAAPHVYQAAASTG